MRRPKPRGSWFIDVSKGKQSLVIEYRPKLGFGITSTPDGGVRRRSRRVPRQRRANPPSVSSSCFRSRQRTKPQRVELLKQLREGRGVSQVELAELLGIRQPTVSKMERRGDVNVSTLRRFVEAMGGRLLVTAEFPDEHVEIGLGSEKAS